MPNTKSPSGRAAGTTCSSIWTEKRNNSPSPQPKFLILFLISTLSHFSLYLHVTFKRNFSLFYVTLRGEFTLSIDIPQLLIFTLFLTLSFFSFCFSSTYLLGAFTSPPSDFSLLIILMIMHLSCFHLSRSSLSLFH